jgi:hypothetical protein
VGIFQQHFLEGYDSQQLQSLGCFELQVLVNFGVQLLVGVFVVWLVQLLV